LEHFLEQRDLVVARVGRRGAMLGGVATMIVAATVLAAPNALPALFVGRVRGGVAIGLGAGTATTYLIELRWCSKGRPGSCSTRRRRIGRPIPRAPTFTDVPIVRARAAD